ncbi:hypothetical protein BT67DRAFT_54273 [Trichocladium antarcticum]|uniref:Uncharacterized protein n=1 Tax=Trichocladium antarcticum TaxID=1450529 RepID=A0AAN6UIW3_9PEZI|nr:hypothetical protein BT67DRAFT_54273 [Trichocladium antarcticum]
MTNLTFGGQPAFPFRPVSRLEPATTARPCCRPHPGPSAAAPVQELQCTVPPSLPLITTTQHPPPGLPAEKPLVYPPTEGISISKPHPQSCKAGTTTPLQLMSPASPRQPRPQTHSSPTLGPLRCHC